ncbi:MAG: regulatory iron-sulfur-containing complex subunit RicT [Planctomycetota bacterium]
MNTRDELVPPPEDATHWARVRYGQIKHRGPFLVSDTGLRPGDRCVVRSNRGIELGQILSPPVPADEETQSGCGGCHVVKKMSPEDERREAQLQAHEERLEFRYCKDRIRELGLPIKLLRAEHLFGGRKIIFYYTADGRVDFRQLVRILAGHFKRRIEMRQIGVRDAARLLGGVGICGREVCCSSWLDKMPPITIRMAKEQGRPLTPERNCGACGRLRCCLRYELDEETGRRLE